LGLKNGSNVLGDIGEMEQIEEGDYEQVLGATKGELLWSTRE
jgi:hypothetical protein